MRTGFTPAAMIAVLLLTLAAEPSIQLREQARSELSAHCGMCHTLGLKTAKPKALAVFDLTAAEFASKMTELQLKMAAGKLVDNPASEDRSAPKAEQDLFARFVAAELARRERAAKR